MTPLFPFRQSPVVRLEISAPGGERRRRHPEPHPPSVVAEVKAYIETTTLTHRQIAAKTGVDQGTISRWSAKHGWVRPPGCFPRAPRPHARYVPNLVGRVLAQ